MFPKFRSFSLDFCVYAYRRQLWKWMLKMFNKGGTICAVEPRIFRDALLEAAPSRITTWTPVHHISSSIVITPPVEKCMFLCNIRKIMKELMGIIAVQRLYQCSLSDSSKKDQPHYQKPCF